MEAYVNGSQPHPLLLSSVLEGIFPYLNYQTLKSSRLVCTSWNKITRKHFQQKTQLQLKFEPKTRNGSPSSHSPLDFINTFKFELQNPKYPLYSTLSTSAKNFKDFQKFRWLRRTEIRNEIKSLELIDMDFPQQVTFLWLKEIMSQWCPQLQTLTIKFPLHLLYIFHSVAYSFEDLKDVFASPLTNLDTLNLVPVFQKCKMSAVPEYTKSLLNSIINLKSLTIPMSLLEVISNPNHWPSHSTLTELNLQHQFLFENYFHTLNQLCLPKLKKLTLTDFDCGLKKWEHFVRAISQVISNHCGTLEQLSFKVVKEEHDIESESGKRDLYSEYTLEQKRRRFADLSRPQITFEFSLPNLLTFENEDFNRWGLASFDFLLEMPNLQKLTLKTTDVTSDPIVENFIGENLSLLTNPHLNLKELRYELVFKCFGVAERIVRCCPNLEVLHISLTECSEALVIAVLDVLSNCEKLEVLKLNISSHRMMESNACFYTAIALALPKFPKLRKVKFSYKWKKIIWTALPNGRQPKRMLRLDLLDKNTEKLEFLNQQILKAPALTCVSFEGFNIEKTKYWEMVSKLSSQLVCLKFKDCLLENTSESLSGYTEQPFNVVWGKFSNFITTSPNLKFSWS